MLTRNVQQLELWEHFGPPSRQAPCEPVGKYYTVTVIVLRVVMLARSQSIPLL